jgi:hypothetical protein
LSYSSWGLNNLLNLNTSQVQLDRCELIFLNLGDLLVGFFSFEVDVGERERVVDLLVVFVVAGVAIADH